ncbi:MAG: hypothetical protein A2381_17390 [Bdellovibrionales bacterium RIFOXYB1_FULL_37_110]|nr:MAG: hypothetical protein A2181_00910 [Bdellovibrionales bacterium RIFOXYA1_FULL_38_20]OFZ48052.1 MAG: hypothetical protein A2417_15380 [Bdellovibrionales bacterium RIFOXYC1_FULL_37_79]OFZ58060.1 MAG: hypothetical protein A2381_17390 [Bdellovibrionales bacterium RIFOXYB1_FULL_37_110]OFZ58210.1 MAG: hypothetical protein A2328_09840 [Bdellovibrionales bacterium RIFOXYB2_FULL_36_6]OFZ63345.1 MAG: hypothetical protein A2577_17510 [Bdellovibrionales bacterium RIFOXYD1_FULL_36_51]
MSINLISKPIIDQELESLKIRCNKLKKNGIIPNLQVLLVGNNKASKIYTNRKKKFCESFGAKCDIHHLDENISVNDFVIELNKISSAANVHGAFVQLPLPKHLANLEIEKLIPAEKDVDGFHPFNLFSLLSDNKKNDYFRPCTPYGVMSLLKYYNISVSGKHAVIIGRSMIVGKPMQMLLTNANATVTLCHSKTENLSELTQKADIIVSAIGKPNFLNETFIHPSQKNKTVVIDVGINTNQDGNLCGDVDFNKVSPLVYAITPVPGGVGPLTILTLSQNLLQAAEKNI